MRYDDKSKVYRLYDPHKKKIILNRSVTFDESEIGLKYLDEEISLLEEKNLWVKID
jgi:hypothetical protein